jgi:uncharacterized protein
MKKKIPVPSPCISVCAIDEKSGFCKGCFRTMAEIAEWEYFDEARKQEVWDLLEQRRAEAGPHYSPY